MWFSDRANDSWKTSESNSAHSFDLHGGLHFRKTLDIQTAQKCRLLKINLDSRLREFKYVSVSARKQGVALVLNPPKNTKHIVGSWCVFESVCKFFFSMKRSQTSESHAG